MYLGGNHLMGAPELILACSRRSDCGDSTKRSCEQEKQWRRVVGSESECCLLSPSSSLPSNLLPLSDFTLHYVIACKPLLGFHRPNLAHNHSYTAARILQKQLVIFSFFFSLKQWMKWQLIQCRMILRLLMKEKGRMLLQWVVSLSIYYTHSKLQ